MSNKLRPGQKLQLKSVEELLGVSNEESAMDIEIAKIRPFKDHPFKVVDDEKMQDLVESIRVNGILSPVLIRPVGFDKYELMDNYITRNMIKGNDQVFKDEKGRPFNGCTFRYQLRRVSTGQRNDYIFNPFECRFLIAAEAHVDRDSVDKIRKPQDAK